MKKYTISYEINGSVITEISVTATNKKEAARLGQFHKNKLTELAGHGRVQIKIK